MAATLAQFKEAFSGKVSVDPLLKTDRQAEAALKELKGAVQSLDQAAPVKERFQTALLDLVQRYAETKKGNGRQPDKLGQELEEIHRDTLAQIAQVQGDVESGAGAAPPSMEYSSETCEAGDDDHDGGNVCMGPEPKGDESLYRSNLQGIQKELDATLKATPPDNDSREIQKRLKETVSKMEFAATSGDFQQAQVYADDVLGILQEYKRAVAAYNKRDQAARDAQAAYETRYAELDWDINGLGTVPPPDPASTAIHDEFLREKEQSDLAVLEANFAKALEHLNKVGDALKRYRASLEKHKQDAAAQLIKDAPKRNYEANFNGIKSKLDSLTRNPPAPKDPDAPLLKKIADLKKQLQKQVAVKDPDYSAANKVVNEIRAQIGQYDLRQAAKQKLKDDAAEAQAKSTYPGDLAAVDQFIEFHYQLDVGGGAPWDKQAQVIYDKLIKARALYKQQEPYFNSRSKQSDINAMKALIAEYKAANVAAWQGIYEKTRAQIPEKDLKWALDPALGEGAMKKEQQKLKDLFKGMESAVSSKSWYEATTKASLLYQTLWRVKTINYTTPGPNGAEVTVRPQLLGAPMDAPTVYTLLRLLKRDGSGSIDHPEGAKLNKAGESLTDTWQQLIERKSQWTKDIDTLKKSSAKISAALQNVKNAAKAIKNGAGGNELKKLIQEYVTAEGEVVVAVQKLGPGFTRYEIAFNAYSAALIEQSQRSAERKKDDAKDKYDDEAKKVEERKSFIRNAVGMVANFFDPKEWLMVPAALVVFGVQEWAVSAVPEDRLKMLKTELEEATRKLQQVQDELGIKKVELAFNGIKAAAEDQGVNRTVVMEKIKILEMVSSRIVAMMKKSGPVTEAAANSLELRSALQGAKQSTAIYIETAQTLDAGMQQLAGRYSTFGGAFSDSSTKYQDAVKATAGGNASTLYEASAYLKTLIPGAKSALDEVDKVGGKANAEGFYKMLPELKKAV